MHVQFILVSPKEIYISFISHKKIFPKVCENNTQSLFIAGTRVILQRVGHLSVMYPTGFDSQHQYHLSLPEMILKCS